MRRHQKMTPAERTLAERLAPMSIADIDAMTNGQLAELMDATEQEVAAEPRIWREAAKVATDEFAERLSEAVRSGRATVITDPSEIRRRLGGRPRVGRVPGAGPSSQVRVRVTASTREALETIAASEGKSLSEVSREALDEYVARHAS